MISTVLAALLSFAAQQVQDSAAQAHNAYTACLRAFMQHSIDGHMAVPAFNEALDHQCATQEAAFRAAVVQRETSFGSNAQQAQQAATDEVTDAKANFRELFQMSAPAH